MTQKAYRHVYSLLLMLVILPGCLTTRAELRESEVKRPTISAAQERQAQSAARLDDYDQQFRTLNGRIEQAENQIGQVNANESGRLAQEQKRREEIEKRFKAYEEALAKLEGQVATLSEELRASQQKGHKDSTPTSGKESLIAADAAFEQKDWKTAIVEYENYRKSYPKGKNYPTATLRIGVAFLELNKKEEGKVFLEEVVAKFPSSKEAKKASQRLKTMK